MTFFPNEPKCGQRNSQDRRKFTFMNNAKEEIWGFRGDENSSRA